LDNTNWRAGGRGGLEGRVSKWETGSFCRLAGCTEDRRAGRWTAEKGGPAGYGKGRDVLQKRAALRPPFSLGHLSVKPAGPPSCAAHCPVLLCSLPARPSVQLASLQKIHVFNLATRPSSPPIPPALRLVLSVNLHYNTNSLFYCWPVCKMIPE